MVGKGAEVDNEAPLALAHPLLLSNSCVTAKYAWYVAGASARSNLASGRILDPCYCPTRLVGVLSCLAATMYAFLNKTSFFDQSSFRRDNSTTKG